ncbi:hypothetical protein [Streptomyces sp. NPDC051909]|uniref:hypothetical protein n=1 Tax=Streptomyces sp. NPDC051909 TaxID=3154944 RepID=UPI00342381DD
MYRHFIAPSRGFTQFSHDLIRHPSLGSDAVRLLTWQLSLPAGARESLSRTAEKARIGACAFTRAKRQLKAAGFVHERRVQGPGGRWVTQQLVSNRPLSEGAAAKLLGRTPAPIAASPSPVNPAVGEPTPPPTDGHPKDEDLGENNSILPPEPEPELEPDNVPEEARALVGTLHLLSPHLRHIPPGMRDELARLAAAWLAAGHTPADVQAHLLRGLPKDSTPVHRPGGLVRYLLRAIPPVAPMTPPQPPPPTGPRLSARIAAMRECEGSGHDHTRLFRPVGDETVCDLCVPDLIGQGGS